jgi:nuclear mRNA export protein PCID2/THP1
LQAAFDQCHSSYISHRRKILKLLLASNILIGKFPSQHFYALPEAEAAGYRTYIEPLITAVKKGNLEEFRRLTDFKQETACWLWNRRMLLQIRNRVEVIVNRSLVRRVFILFGEVGDATKRKAPTLDILKVHRAFRFLEWRALSPLAVADDGPGKRHPIYAIMQQTADGNDILDSMPPGYKPFVHPEFRGAEDVDQYPFPILPTLEEVETSILPSLISQGLITGYQAARSHRLAIRGAAKFAGNAVKAGFPEVFATIKARYNDVVPGWRMSESEMSELRMDPVENN